MGRPADRRRRAEGRNARGGNQARGGGAQGREGGEEEDARQKEKGRRRGSQGLTGVETIQSPLVRAGFFFFSPEGTSENSPARERRVEGREKLKSRRDDPSSTVPSGLASYAGVDPAL